MKICAISDTHGLLPKIEPCDVLLIAGDISPLDIQHNLNEMDKWIYTSFCPWIRSLNCTYKILVAGNHDYYLQNLTTSSKLVLEMECGGDLIYLNNTCTSIYTESKTLKIFGTPWCHEFGYWPFMIPDKVLVEKFKEIPENLDILVSHDPPFNLTDADLNNYNGCKSHCGNIVLSNEIIIKRPKIVISGHIHSGFHSFEEYDRMKFVNVSQVDNNYNNIYKPFYFEL